MGPEQTLRRETWTDRREFSVRVSFISNKKDKYVFFGVRTRKKQKKRPCEERTTTDPVFGRKTISITLSNNPIQ